MTSAAGGSGVRCMAASAPRCTWKPEIRSATAAGTT